MAQQPMQPPQPPVPGQRPSVPGGVPPNGGGAMRTPGAGGPPMGGPMQGPGGGMRPPPPSPVEGNSEGMSALQADPGNVGMLGQDPEENTPPQEGTSNNEKLQLEALLQKANIAETLDEDELAAIASELHSQVSLDRESCKGWFDRMQEYLDMAMQVKVQKSWPWRGAANVKYPLLTIAAMQFHARAMPALIKKKAVVRGKAIGYDPGGTKTNRAERIGKHMTYQLVDESPVWEDDMDKLCIVLPICGSVFKEVYWDTLDDRPAIDLILPDDMIVNYWAESMQDARRITRRHYFYENTIIEKQREGAFLEFDLPGPVAIERSRQEDRRQSKRSQGTTDTENMPYEVWKTQCYLDLDDDGYKEPYLVWMLENAKKILRIEAAYSVRSIKRNTDGKIQRIIPRHRFVKYDFIPSPDGGFLGMGFGILLGSINEAVNTMINQLIDQGTIHSTSGGFISKGIRMKGGKLTFEPNEWKVVQSTGEDLQKGIVPLPTKEPSSVLAAVSQQLIQAGKQIIAINEMGTGKTPGQNTPAHTTQTAVEEGMKLFNAVYARVWRAMKREFKILFDLNRTYITDTKYFSVLDGSGSPRSGEAVSKEDYNNDDLDVMPEADPEAASENARLMKAQQLRELIPLGAVDPSEAGQRILEALDQPNIEQLKPQPRPDPKVEAAKVKAEGDRQKLEHEMQLDERRLALEEEFKRKEAELKLQVKEKELELKEKEIALKMQELEMKMQAAQAEHGMKMQQGQEKHWMTIQQFQEKKAAGMDKKKEDNGSKDSES